MSDADFPTKVAVLGSTGSVGRQTLGVVRSLSGQFEIYALAANQNVDLLNQQIEIFKPQLVVIGKQQLKGKITKGRFKLLTGAGGLEEIAGDDKVDLVVFATTGMVALPALLAAIKAKKKIAIANKEVLVIAGGLVTKLSRENKVDLRPVDSEHCAIWQCLAGEKLNQVNKLILTASGGPFRGWDLKRIKNVTPAQALKHPTWSMGAKITIDSATLLNKGLEVIEAHWLFNQPYEKIAAIIHPQSLIHSLVEFVDGSLKAQLAAPDMRLAIQYALTYPQRQKTVFNFLDLVKSNHLDFYLPDIKKFPCLHLAVEAGKKGGTYPVVLVTADEILVEQFLKGKISFWQIPVFLEKTLAKHQSAPLSLENISAVQAWTKETLENLINRR